MYKFNIRRAALVSVVAFTTTLGFCALADHAKAQTCVQWSCVWTNTKSANPQQQCTCVLFAPPPPPQSSVPGWGSYASDAPVDFLKPYR
jgi:hypothetical protein